MFPMDAFHYKDAQNRPCSISRVEIGDKAISRENVILTDGTGATMAIPATTFARLAQWYLEQEALAAQSAQSE